jgi:NAD(P)-dependent dehydrogenase (short-subunit alcohol dehydrogenase family)
MPKSSSKRGLVLVTGGSGYVAGYCIAELLNNGWRVRSTVRSSAKVKAVRASISNIGSKTSEIEFVEADLNSDAGWSQATGGAQYVLHVASPVPVTDPKNDDELVRPARDGTLRVLKAARDAAAGTGAAGARAEFAASDGVVASCQGYGRSPNVTEEMPPQVLLTATGFAAREALAVLRKHNIATAPLLLRAGLSEHGVERTTDESNGLAHRVSAIGQCRFLEYAAEAMNDSAFGLHLARQIGPRDVGLYFYAGSAARDLGEALALFSRYCRIANEAFRLTQRSADTAVEFELVGLPRYAARHNMEYVVAGIRTALRTITGRKVHPHESHVRPQPEFRCARVRAGLRLSGRVRRAKQPAINLSRCSAPSANHRRSKAAPRPPALLRCCSDGARRKTGNTALCG